MPDFIFAYHGGEKPEDPQEIEKLMGRWNDWIAEVGDAMICPGKPVGLSKTVSSNGITDDGGSNPLSGFSMVKADTIEEAIKHAKGCPHLDHGTIEVAEMMEMPTSGDCEKAA